MVIMLSFEELNKRADEVFLLDEGDEVISVDGEGDCVRVRMIDKDGLEFDLMPDMTERPEALAYLKGERNDFND
jgi:hypothetical protein